MKYNSFSMQDPNSEYNYVFKIVSDVSNEHLEEINVDFKKAILPQVLSKLPEIGITVEELRHLYFGKKEVSEETLMNYSTFIGNEFFVRGIMDTLQQQKSAGCYKSTYLYHFDYNSETSLVKKVFKIGLPGILSLIN